MNNEATLNEQTNLDQLLEANADKKNALKKIIIELEKEKIIPQS